MTPVKITRLVLPSTLALLLAACGSPAAATPPAPPPTQVQAVAVQAKHVAPWDDLSGRVEAIDSVELRARVTGPVTSIGFRDGDDVAEGTVLFTIDARPYQAVLARAKADLARAKARLELTEIEVKRGERLLAEGAVTRAQVDPLVSAERQARAEVQASAAQVEIARLDVEFTRVRAPIAGRIGRTLVSRGDHVGPQTPLAQLVSLDPVHVYVSSDEQTLGTRGNPVGTTAHVGLAGETGHPRTGKVDFVDPAVDPQTGTVRVRIIVPNPDKRLAPGLYARVRLTGGSSFPALLVDEKAILTDQDRKYVFVIAKGVAERRDVKLGRSVDGLRVVTAGLTAGEQVIAGGVQKVYPGAAVTP